MFCSNNDAKIDYEIVNQPHLHFTQLAAKELKEYAEY